MRTLLLALFFVLIPLAAEARDYPPFLNTGALPNAIQFLPPPPDPNSPQYYCDWNIYLWGKTQRASSRGTQAKADANVDLASLVIGFSQTLNIALSEKETPKIYELIGRTADTLMAAIKGPKKFHQRQRPYAAFGEHSLIPEAEASHNPMASYPSGHAALGWGLALVLAELLPQHQDVILKRGFEFGQSRIIAGYHFQSDVDAGRLTASAVVARLHADDEFKALMKAAKHEFSKKSKK